MATLYRSRDNRYLSGVLGGIGETYHIDPTILRLAYAAAALFTGVVPLVVLYIVAAIIMPERPVSLPQNPAQ